MYVNADTGEPAIPDRVEDADTWETFPELLYNAWAQEGDDPLVGSVISDWLQRAPAETSTDNSSSLYRNELISDLSRHVSDSSKKRKSHVGIYEKPADHPVQPASVNNAYHGNYYGTTSLHDNAKAQFGDTYQTTIIATTTSSSSSSCLALAANLVGGAAGGFAFAAANTYYSNATSEKSQTGSSTEHKGHATTSVVPKKTAVPVVNKGILFEGTQVTSTLRQNPTSTFEWDPTPLPPPEAITSSLTGFTEVNSDVQKTLYTSAQLSSQMMAQYPVFNQHTLKMQQHRPQAQSPKQEAKQQEYLESRRLLEETNSLSIPSQYQKRFVDSVLKGTGLYGLPPSTWGNLKSFLLSRTGGMHKISTVRKVQLEFAKEREAAKSSHSASSSPPTVREEDGTQSAPPIMDNEQESTNISTQETSPHAAVSTTGSVLASTSKLYNDGHDSVVLNPTGGSRLTSWSATTRYLTGDTAPQIGHIALKRKRTGSGDDGGPAPCKLTI